MKIQKLILSVVTLSVFLISCSKEEINGVNIQPKESFEQVTVESSVISSPNARVSTATNLKAYIFIEPLSKHTLIKGHLNNVTSSSTRNLLFLGFHGVNRPGWMVNFPNYISMPHWTNGNLPRIIESEIPQTNGGIDNYGNEIRAFNFKTIKIPKNTINSHSWIVVLIPIQAMNNDIQRQRRINVVEKINTTTKSNKIYLTDNVLFGTIINYQGSIIPAGQYRVYSTYPAPHMRLNLNSTNDVYIRGFN